MVRLKGACIIAFEEAVKKPDGSLDFLKCSVVPNSHSGADTSGVKCKGVIQWVSAEDARPVTLKHYKSLLNPDIPEGDFMDRLNPDSEQLLSALAEPYAADAPTGTRFQFLRMGYYIKDRDGSFIEIVGLKDSFRK